MEAWRRTGQQRDLQTALPGLQAKSRGVACKRSPKSTDHILEQRVQSVSSWNTVQAIMVTKHARWWKEAESARTGLVALANVLGFESLSLNSRNAGSEEVPPDKVIDARLGTFLS